jgi:hypothetical protein
MGGMPSDVEETARAKGWVGGIEVIDGGIEILAGTGFRLLHDDRLDIVDGPAELLLTLERLLGD